MTDVLNRLANVSPIRKNAVNAERLWWLPGQPPGTFLAESLGSALSKNMNISSAEVLEEIFGIFETTLGSGTKGRAATIVAGLVECLQLADARDVFKFSLVASYSAVFWHR